MIGLIPHKNFKVSIIIPCYNSLGFIEATLKSVQKQSYQDIEIIVIDDGSTDGSFEFLSKINSSKFSLVKNTGKGACAARNHGLKLAQGDYIQFLDADDLLSPKKIENQVKLLQKYPNRISVCSTSHFYEEPQKGRVTDKGFMFSTDKPEDFLLKLYGADGQNHNMVQTSAWLTPRQIIDKIGFWNEELLKDQDGEFFCRAVMASKGVIYEPKALNYYRKHKKGSNIANNKAREYLQSQLKALDSKALQLKAFSDSQAYKNAFALQYKLLAIDAFPHFLDLHRSCIKRSKVYGGSNHLPVLGGHVVEVVKKTFGWRIAKALSYGLHKILKY